MKTSFYSLRLNESFFVKERYDIVLGFLKNIANISTFNNLLILDVGCGTGFFVDFYFKRGAKEITGIDITKTSISMLKEKYPAYNFYVADISDLNYPVKLKEKFDIINAFDVLYHITDDSKFEMAMHNISSLCAGGSYADN